MAMVHTDNLQQRYQRFHDENIHYQTNNWLMDDLAFLACGSMRSIVEIGCGNGRFLELAAASFNRVVGIDFARSPVLDEILGRHDTVEFHQCDVTAAGALEEFRADVVVSADVLEHLLPGTLDETIGAIDAVAPNAWHTIACYEADWTHPSVFSPEEWLDRFCEIDPGYRIVRLANRRDRATQPVVTIAKGIEVRLGSS